MANQLFWCSHPALHCMLASKDSAQYVTQKTGIKQVDELIMNHQPKQELSKCDNLALQGVNDLIQLSNGSIENILHLLRVRFYKGQIYTQLSNQNLISINPEQQMQNLFTQESLIYYKKSMRLAQDQYQKLCEIPPHVYKIGDMAKKEIFSENNKWKNSSIIALGENGSGKTTNINALIYYLAKESKSGQFETAMLGASIEKKIKFSTPILQAFGSASTQQNKLSTRFGKYLEILFDEKFKIKAGMITAYLLERSRVSSTPSNESNFKIFEYLLAGYHSRGELKVKILQMIPDYCVDIDELQQQLGELELLKASNYVYLSNNKESDINSDLKEFLTICECLSTIDLDSDQIISIFKVLAGILYLGNIAINGIEVSSINENDAALVKASSYLGIPGNQLCKILTESEVSGGSKEIIKIQFNSRKAGENRDALAKHLYANLFEVIIQQINIQIGSEGIQTESKQKLVIFDSIGYEKNLDLESGQQYNSLEQFNINYTNEKLKSFQFDQTILIDQGIHFINLEHYQQERIAFKLIDVKQSKTVIELYEKPIKGLFSIIQDFTQSTRSNDSFINKLQNEQFSEDLILRSTKTFKIQFDMNPEMKQFQRHKQQWFGINHSAGALIYFIDGFFDKNKDYLNDNISTELRKSELELIQQIQNNHVQKQVQIDSLMQSSSIQQLQGSQQSTSNKDTVNVSSFYRGKKQGFITQIYQVQMKIIIQNLSKTKPFFINCIRANTKQFPMNFDSQHVLQQLIAINCQQILDFKIKGFPCQMKHEEFLSNFRILFPQVTTLQELQQKLKNNQKYNHITQGQLISFGLTEVFMKNEVIDFFQSQMNLVKQAYAKRIINLFKVNMFRKKLKNKSPKQQQLEQVEVSELILLKQYLDNFQLENQSLKMQIESVQAQLNIANQSLQQQKQYTNYIETQLINQQQLEQYRKEQLTSVFSSLYNNENHFQQNSTQFTPLYESQKSQQFQQSQQLQQLQFSTDNQFYPVIGQVQSIVQNESKPIYVGPLVDLQDLIENLQLLRQINENNNQMEPDLESQKNQEQEYKNKIAEALLELQEYLNYNNIQ